MRFLVIVWWENAGLGSPFAFHTTELLVFAKHLNK